MSSRVNYSSGSRRNYKKTNRKIKSNLNSRTRTSKMSDAITSVNRKVDYLKKQVKKDEEIRYFDQLQTASVSTTGNLILINGLLQGDDGYNREGDWITIKSIHIKGNLFAGDPTNLVRVMLICDKQSNGTAPTVPLVLDTSVISTPTLAFRNPAYFERFTILYDKLFNLVDGTVSDQNTFRINLKTNIKTNYSLGNTGTVTDISRCSLYLLLVSDSSAATHPGANITTRIKFIA